MFFFFFSSRRRHTRFDCDWSSDVCSSDLLCRMRFEREVPGVEKADDRSRNVALECLRAGRQEERIVLAPHGEERWLVSAEVGLESRVERDVAFVVAKQVQLHFIRTRARQIEVVQ